MKTGYGYVFPSFETFTIPKRKRGFLTDWAEDFIGAVWAVLLPVAGVRDVNTATVITFELVL